MLEAVFKLLTPKISLFAIAAFALIIAGKQTQLYFVRADLETTKTSLATCSANLAVSVANTAALKSQIELQNEAIRSLSAKAKVSEANAIAKARAALKRGQKARADAEAIPGSGAEVMKQWLVSTFPQ